VDQICVDFTGACDHGRGVRTPGTSWPVPRLRIGLVSWTVEVPAVSSSIELAAAIVAAHISHRIELSFDKVAVFS